ncbi:MAG: type protein, partial [Microbacteriaceae bacterium]|nr:type protein [Microbacteriaceae bacterium]
KRSTRWLALLGACSLGALALITATAPTAANASPTTYYINNAAGSNCSNLYTSTSIGAPWCDFTNVNSATFAAGDSILLARGDTWHGGMQLSGSGTSATYVTVGAYGAGARPAISLASGVNDICIYATNLDYWSFDSLDLSHCVAGIAIKYTSLGHQGLRFSNIIAHDMKGITFGQSSTTPTNLPGLHYGTGIYISSAGTAVPTPTQWVYKDVKVDDFEATNVDDGFEFSADGFSSTFPANSVQDVSMHRVYLHGNDACPLVVNSTNFELVDSTFSANGSRGQSVGTTGIWFWYSSHFSVINSVLGGTPNTGSPDQTALDIEGYDDSGILMGDYIAGDAGGGVEILGLGGRSGDFQTNHAISDSAFASNFTSGSGQPGSIRIDNPNGISVTGSATNNLYAEPSTTFSSVSGSSSVSFTNNVEATSPSLLFNQGAQYSATQGSGGWRYQTYNGASWSDAAYDATNNRWGTSGAYLNTFESLPPASSSQWAAHAWTAPSAGTVNIRSRVLKADVGGGDGVAVRITKNGSQIWPVSGGAQSLGATDATGVSASLSNVAVTAGDVLRFEVNAGSSGSNSHDLTSWNPSIGYSTASSAVNDSDPAVTYSSVSGGGWTYSPSRGWGDYGDDEHYTTTNGDSVSYTCTACSTLGFLTEKTPTSGTYDVQVDSGTITSVNTYNATRIARQLAFVQAGMAVGNHTIRITKTSGSYGEVDAFLTSDPINDDDASLVYAAAAGGGWTDSNARGFGDYRDDEHWTTTNGDSVTVPFYGSGVAFITETEPGGGNNSAQLCDASGGSCSTAITVNTFTSTRLSRQIVWQNSSPTAAQQQSVKITKTSGSYGQVDAFMVIP